MFERRYSVWFAGKFNRSSSHCNLLRGALKESFYFRYQDLQIFSFCRSACNTEENSRIDLIICRVAWLFLWGVYPSVRLYAWTTAHLSVRPSVALSLCPFVDPSARPCVFFFVGPSVNLSFDSSLCRLVRLPICSCQRKTSI